MLINLNLKLLATALAPRILAVMPRNQERQLQRLLLIKPRIAVRRVVGVEILVVQALTTPRALCDRIARELEVHAAQEGAVLLVDLEG